MVLVARYAKENEKLRLGAGVFLLSVNGGGWFEECIGRKDDILSNFLDVIDNRFSSDAKYFIELVEASHLGLEDEKILDVAKMFAIF
ncbi:amino-terminal domain terpene synthase [Medicago truncatula]|uniref:Amino-terminal domain terpene synthase n=1 Tax=Medicago truncatula TaxID=3880 RepID=G7L104_MEDTR|nr:amino-terminal domain terpene synthase [Medicago truncatula]